MELIKSDMHEYNMRTSNSNISFVCHASEAEYVRCMSQTLREDIFFDGSVGNFS